jgi:drug/metabolite transporter (DMT)-like permease
VTLFSLLLVLGAALLHALWNLLAKRARGGLAFTWLFSALAVLIWAPVVAIYMLIWKPHVNGSALALIAGSALLHVAYFLLLQRGYRAGDLSVVYPLARGTGPLLSMIGAILLLGERPSPLAVVGAMLILVGVFSIAGGGQMMRSRHVASGVGYGLLTGLLIASYTLWDKWAVSVILVAPLLLEYGSCIGSAMLLSPSALQRRAEVRREWRTHRLEAFGIALLSSLAYIMVLTALVTSPVSYIAPARELSILFGALMGAWLLKEGHVQRRLLSAGLMVAGIVLLALG